MGGKPVIKLKIRLIASFVVFLFLFSIFNNCFVTNAIAQEDASDGGSPPTPATPIKYILYQAGKFSTNFAPIVQMFAGAAIADPPVIEIGYNETVIVQIGMMDLKTGNFSTEPTPDYAIKRVLSFDVIEYPTNNTEYSWSVEFNPFIVDLESGPPAKTNVSISLRAPPISKNSIQTGKIKIHIADSWSYGNLWWPENIPGYESFIKKLFWFADAIMAHYGNMSGKTIPDDYYVDILVKVKPYHAAELETVPLVQLAPRDITSIPIGITNIGNYNDTFNFRVVSEHEDIKISNPISITLAPGEKKDSYLAVSVPQNVFDTGTIHEIKIEAYSIDNPNVTIGERTVNIETKGVYVNQGIGFSFGLLFFFILLIGVFFYYYKRRLMLEKTNVKLDKSKEKSKKIKSKTGEKPVEIKKEKKKTEKSEEAKPEKLTIQEKKSTIEKITAIENRKKQRLTDRIKREQEKQKRKLR